MMTPIIIKYIDHYFLAEPTHNANNVSHFYHLSPNNMTMERFTLDVHGNMDRRTIRENFNFEVSVLCNK